MNWLMGGLFVLLIWFAVEAEQYENKQQVACENKGGVLMTDRNSEYICINKEVLVK